MALTPECCFQVEGLFLEDPPEKYSCPICLSPVQREAFLTQCCGKHFCFSCISRLAEDTAKPCPMCKSSPVLIFPNKERQREIGSLLVHCPVQLQAVVPVGDFDFTNPGGNCKCDWIGRFSCLSYHLKDVHGWHVGACAAAGTSKAGHDEQKLQACAKRRTKLGGGTRPRTLIHTGEPS